MSDIVGDHILEDANFQLINDKIKKVNNKIANNESKHEGIEEIKILPQHGLITP